MSFNSRINSIHSSYYKWYFDLIKSQVYTVFFLITDLFGGKLEDFKKTEIKVAWNRDYK